MTRAMSDVLQDIFERWGLTRASSGALVVVRWPEIAGPAVADHSRARDVKNGLLTVHVDSSLWATELAAAAPLLLERIAAAVGEGVVTGIRFVAGRDTRGRPGGRKGGGPGGETEPDPAGRGAGPDPADWPDRRALAAVPLSDEERELLAEFTNRVADPELARAAERWAALALKARKWRRR